jgi:DNA-binding response OmpR family regulator
VVTRRTKILLVESDRDLALSMRKQLEIEGYQVVLAGTGEDALWLAQEEHPQLIALDIHLPDIDGFVVLERLRKHPATIGIPAIVISVLSETKKGYALGAVDYVVKPFEESKLLASVRLALTPHEGETGQDILVVDDDDDIRGLLLHALSYHGYEVRIAADGQEALESIGRRLPDLILLDLKMPRMDGYEVIRRLKANDATRPVPIIVITASPVDKERDKVRVLGMGATQYITKPLSIEALVREIRSIVEERSQE